MDQLNDFITQHFASIGNQCLDFICKKTLIKTPPKIPSGTKLPPLPPGAKLEVGGIIKTVDSGFIRVEQSRLVNSQNVPATDATTSALGKQSGAKPTAPNAFFTCFDGQRLLSYAKTEDGFMSGVAIKLTNIVTPAQGLEGWQLIGGQELSAWCKTLKGRIMTSNEDQLFVGQTPVGDQVALRFTSKPIVLLKDIQANVTRGKAVLSSRWQIQYQTKGRVTYPSKVVFTSSTTALGTRLESANFVTDYKPREEEGDIDRYFAISPGAIVLDDKEGLTKQGQVGEKSIKLDDKLNPVVEPNWIGWGVGATVAMFAIGGGIAWFRNRSRS